MGSHVERGNLRILRTRVYKIGTSKIKRALQKYAKEKRVEFITYPIFETADDSNARDCTPPTHESEEIGRHVRLRSTCLIRLLI